MNAWEQIERVVSDEWESARVIARRAGGSLQGVIHALSYAVNKGLVLYRERQPPSKASYHTVREYRRRPSATG